MLPEKELKYVNIGLKKMRLKNLADYYSTERWKILKQGRRTMGDEVCFVCDVPESILEEKMQLHHRTYKNLGNETGENLVWLCTTCHESIHDDITQIIKGELSLTDYCLYHQKLIIENESLSVENFQKRKDV